MLSNACFAPCENSSGTEQNPKISGYLPTKAGASLDPRNPQGHIIDSSIYRPELASKAWTQAFLELCLSPNHDSIGLPKRSLSKACQLTVNLKANKFGTTVRNCAISCDHSEKPKE